MAMPQRPGATPRTKTQTTKAKPARLGSAEFKARCLELVSHVKEARAEYVVTRHGRPMARLVPVEGNNAAEFIGSMRGTVLQYERPFAPVPGAWNLNEDADAAGE